MLMKRVSLLVLLAIGANGVAARAQEVKKAPARAAVQEKASAKAGGAAKAADDRSADQAAIQTLLDAFIKSFNAGDAKAVAATYTPNAIVIDEDGVRTEGRAPIQAQYESYFAANPGNTIAIQVNAFRLLGAETALEEGHATITTASATEAPEITRFTAIYVKYEGHWLQAVVRDERASEPSPHQQLKQLEWLVGEWVNESPDAVVLTTCKWAHDGNFLDRDFTIKTKGRHLLSGTQRIGWDATRKQFKTWVFDSEGGHGEGYLSNNGDQWVTKLEGVRPDGLTASATNVITRLGNDRMRWQSSDRTLGDVVVPDVVEFVVVRKPPEAGK
jgi:uncharacterized protein (TIGR02246 family)